MSGSWLPSAVLLCFLMGCVGDIEHGQEESNVGDAKGESDDPSESSGGDPSSNDEGNESPGRDDSSTGDDGTSVGGGDSASDDEGSDNEGDDTDPGETTGGDGDGDSTGGEVDSDQLVWRSANVTNFTSYPEPGSSECIDFSGCDYEGQFAGLEGTQPLEWVMSNNIAAVHSKDFDAYAHKTLRLRDGESEIDVVVYDLCSDDDCDDCCTQNASETGFLIDLEIYTAERFGTYHGVVEWACVDC